MREETINTISDQIREIISLMRDKIEDIPRISQLDMELNLNVLYILISKLFSEIYQTVLGENVKKVLKIQQNLY